MPDTVSTVIRIKIRHIHPVFLSLLLKVLFDFTPCHCKQWTNDCRTAVHRPDGAHPTHPPDSASPHQLKQNRLRIVVCMMGKCNLHTLPPALTHCSPVTVVAQLSRCLFKTDSVLFRIIYRINRIDMTRYTMCKTECFHKCRIRPARLSPDTMFHMNYLQRKSTSVTIRKQQQQKTYRIRTA